MRPNSFSDVQAMPMWGLTAGQFSNVPSPRIPDSGLSSSSNVYVSEGRLRVRPSLVEYAPTNRQVPCSHVAHMITQDGIPYLMRTTTDPATGEVQVHAWDGSSWTTIQTGLTGGEDYPPESCMLKGEWLLCPGDDKVYRWTGGAGMVSLDSLQPDPDLKPPDAPSHIASNLSRVFLANGIDPYSGERVPWRVWWCSKGDTLTWDHGGRKPEAKNASFQDLMHDNTEVTGLHYLDGAEILAFKPRSIYIGEFAGGYNLYLFTPVSLDIGCIAGRTIQSWNGLCIFLGANNVYAKPVGGKPQAIGDAIRPRLAKLLNKEYAHRASAVLDPVLGVYWLFVPQNAEATCGKIFACSLKDKFAWTEGEISDPHLRVLDAGLFWPSDSDTRKVIASRDGRIYQMSDSPPMRDGTFKFSAYGWSKTLDFVELLAKAGSETATLQKLSVQGLSGEATGAVRVGPTVASVEASEDVEFGDFDMSQPWDQSFRSGKPQAMRFAQVGVKWPSTVQEPMPVDGITLWSLPRGDARE